MRQFVRSLVAMSEPWEVANLFDINKLKISVSPKSPEICKISGPREVNFP